MPPDEGPPPPPDAKPMGVEICVPVAAVAAESDDSSAVNPEVGDEVHGDFVGKVSRIEGGNAYIALSEINGQEVGAPTDNAEVGPTADDMRALGAQADQGQP